MTQAIDLNKVIALHYEDPTLTMRSNTLKERCLQVLMQVMSPAHAGGFLQSVSQLAWPPDAKVLPKITLIEEGDFPLTPERVNAIVQSDVKFVLFKDNDACFSKEAFLFAFGWKIHQGQIPCLADFCLIDSMSRYHSVKNPCFAPAVIVEMIDREFDRNCFIPYVDDDQVYEKLVDFFCTLEIEKLIDVIAATGSSHLEIKCPRAWMIISQLLPTIKGREKTIIHLVNEWLKKKSSTTLVEKLDRLTGGYRAKYYYDGKIEPISGELDPLQGISLGYSFSYRRNGAWGVSVEAHAEGLLQLKGAPIEHLSIEGPMNEEQLQAVSGLFLKKITIRKNAKLTKGALDLIKRLSIESLSLLREDADSLLDYVGSKVTDLHLWHVSAKGLEKLRHHPIQDLSISCDNQMSDEDFQWLDQMPLQSIFISPSKHLSSYAFQYISSPYLTSVTLYGEGDNTISDGILFLQDRPLEDITLYDTKISGKVMRAIVKLPTLKSLHLMNCTLSRRHIDLLMDAKALKKLFLHKISISEEQIAGLRAKGVDVSGTFLPPSDSTVDLVMGSFERLEEAASLARATTREAVVSSLDSLFNDPKPALLLSIAFVATSVFVFNRSKG